MRVSPRQRLWWFVLRHRTGLTVCLVTALLALVPLLVRNPYQLGLVNLIGIYAVAVLGLNLFIGYAGQISLGHAGFFGLGAYGSALLTVHGWLPPWPALFLTAVLVAGAALLLGIPTLRLHGHYLAMATLGFNYIVHLVLVQWDAVTGGPSGISGIPPLGLGGLAFDNETRFFYLVWGVVLLGVTACLNLMRSGVGRGLAALAQDEVAAATLGVDVKREKVRIFVISAVFASLAGSLYAHYYHYVNPDGFSIFKSLELVIMVVVGGLGSVWGTLLGAMFITLLPYYLEFMEAYFDLIHGLILVLILMFLPQGLVTGLWDHLRLTLARRRLGAQRETL